MEYPNSIGTNGASPGSAIPAADDVAAGVREYAEGAVKNMNEAMTRGRELVLRHPVLSVVGAVAAGYLFAKVVARRGR